MPRRCLSVAVASMVFFCLGGTSVQAAASQKAICAVEQVIACQPFESCERSLPGAVNLPVLLKIDRSAGVVLSRRESGEERLSKIGAESGDDTMHVLQGVDAGTPWNIRIELETGRFTMTSARSDVGYVAFGLCSSKLLN